MYDVVPAECCDEAPCSKDGSSGAAYSHHNAEETETQMKCFVRRISPDRKLVNSPHDCGSASAELRRGGAARRG